MGVSVYVDGFNLYYGALKRRPYRWLNLKALSEEILPQGRSIDKVKYFTARVSGAIDRDAPRRQQVYFNALGTVPEIEIFPGNFLAKTIWRPIINLPVGDRLISSPNPTTIPPGTHVVSGAPDQSLIVGNYQQHAGRGVEKPLPDAVVAKVHTMEEKGSDVNLASHLLNDAWKGLFTEALVITNDTDLKTPIEIVATEMGLPVTLACPAAPVSPALAAVATHTRHISRAMLGNAQFPDPIVKVNGSQITKPSPDW